MRLQYKLFFLLMIALAACTESEKRPADILDEDRMTTLLVNIHIIDGDMLTVPQQPDSLYKYGMGYYLPMLKKYRTDTAQFKKSFTWYSKHPVELNMIYDNVIKTLEKKSDSLNKVPTKVTNPPVQTPANKNALPVQ